MFSRRDLNEALQYVRQQAYMSDDKSEGEPPEIRVTGIGCVQLGKIIVQTLNVRLVFPSLKINMLKIPSKCGNEEAESGLPFTCKKLWSNSPYRQYVTI